jgi:Flp pilus assembly protein TadD
MTRRRHHHRRRYRRERYLTRPEALPSGAPGGALRPPAFEIVDPDAAPALPVEAEPAAPAPNGGPQAHPVADAPAAAPPENGHPANGHPVHSPNGSRTTAIFQDLLAADPAQVAARGRLAQLLDHLGEHDTALAELTACLAREPDDVSLLLGRAAVRAALSRLGEAEEDVRHALRTEPASPDAHVGLGVLLARKGLWRDAIPALRRAVELDPGRAPAWDQLGEALNHVDDLVGALQAFHRSAELRPTGARALRGLGIVYDRLNRPAEAAQMYRRSRELAGR